MNLRESNQVRAGSPCKQTPKNQMSCKRIHGKFSSDYQLNMFRTFSRILPCFSAGSPSERRADNERPLDAAFECMNMNNSSSTKPVEATGDFPHPDNPYRKEGAIVRNQTDPPLLQVEGSERARNNHPNVSTRNNPNARELIREANIKGNIKYYSVIHC